jgi:hypothetical protein
VLWTGRLTWVDHVLAVVLAAGVLVVHNVPYMLSQPFWVDESWVAVSTKAPIGSLKWITSSTPIGWTLLLRLVPGGGQQDLRLLPLVACALAVVLAYYLGRALPLPRYAGVLTAAAVLFAPSMLTQSDLKQYTTEACASVAILLLVACIESRWTRPRLVGVGVVTALGFLFTNTSVIVGFSAILALGLASAFRRDLRRLSEVAVVFAATAVTSGLVFLLFHEQLNPLLTRNWVKKGFFMPTNEGIGAALRFVGHGWVLLTASMGWDLWWLYLVLALAGIASLVVLKRPALAMTVPITVLVVIVASADHKFPFGDLRTSTFWTVLIPVLVAIGVASGIQLVARRSVTVSVVCAALFVGMLVVSAHTTIRTQLIPIEDVRSEVAYVDAHRLAGDVVVVNEQASWAFAYYEGQLTPQFVHSPAVTVGFLPSYPGDPWMILVPNRTPASVSGAMDAAVQQLKREGSASTGRIWIIRTHMSGLEEQAWSKALQVGTVTVHDVGPDPLVLYQPFAAG